MEGKYGPYVKWEKVNATLPKDSDPDELTIQQAVGLITEKQAQKGTKRKATTKKKAVPKKPAAKKSAPKKAAIKKPIAKKPASKTAAKKATQKGTDTDIDVLE